jgi:hypothetical protein
LEEIFICPVKDIDGSIVVGGTGKSGVRAIIKIR